MEKVIRVQTFTARSTYSLFLMICHADHMTILRFLPSSPNPSCIHIELLGIHWEVSQSPTDLLSRHWTDRYRDGDDTPWRSHLEVRTDLVTTASQSYSKTKSRGGSNNKTVEGAHLQRGKQNVHREERSWSKSRRKRWSLWGPPISHFLLLDAFKVSFPSLKYN